MGQSNGLCKESRTRFECLVGANGRPHFQNFSHRRPRMRLSVCVRVNRLSENRHVTIETRMSPSIFLQRRSPLTQTDADDGESFDGRSTFPHHWMLPEAASHKNPLVHFYTTLLTRIHSLTRQTRRNIRHGLNCLKTIHS